MYDLTYDAINVQLVFLEEKNEMCALLNFQEVMHKRDAASLAAEEAMTEASAAETVLRSLRY